MHSQIVIPARLNSSRLPEKLLTPVAGKALLQHVWERGRDAGVGQPPIVATDSERLAEVARGFHAPVVMTSREHRCGSERVAEVARSLSADLVINLQADEVLMDPRLLAKLPDLFRDPSVQMATAVARLDRAFDIGDTSLVKAVLDDQGNVLYFSRLPIPHHNGAERAAVYGHLGVYAYRRPFLMDQYSRPPSSLETAERLEQLRVLQAGHRIRALIWKAEHFGVNTEADLARVRSVLEAQSREEGRGS